MKFSEIDNPDQIQSYLKKILSRTGGAKQEMLYLYHYSNIESIKNIVDSRYLWLSSINGMNDLFERNIITSTKEIIPYYACFSKSEENLGMYSMYAHNSDGAILYFSYYDANKIIQDQSKESNGKVNVRIVRDNKLTDEMLLADVFWSEVCYKDLNNGTIRVGNVFNNRISYPLKEEKLVGYVKLYGWEYEKEVRLIAYPERELSSNEKLAIRIPDGINMKVRTNPWFDKKDDNNKKCIDILKRNNIKVNDSYYLDQVNIK